MNIDIMLSLAHTVASAPGTQAVLLGSGVARSAQIPTGWEVTLDLVRRLAVLDGADTGGDPLAWYTKKYDAEPDYSVLIGSLARTPAERRALLQPYFEPSEAEREAGAKVPTLAHRSIAQLAAKGFLRVILTTNFDRLIETALRDEGIEPTVVSTADSAEGAAPIVHQRCVVVKLHGDYLDDRIKNTVVELSSYDPRMAAYLDRVLDEFGLIICGWSGEWDPALRAAIERCKSRRYTTTWAAMGPLSQRAAQLVALRSAQVITISGADTFFSSLTEKVTSLIELGTTSPLSVATAVATLKRYIAEDRHRVRLEDLLMDETNSVATRLRSDFPFQGGPAPTLPLAAERICKLDTTTEVLRSLFFNGCRLATPTQEKLFLRALLLLTPPEDVAGYNLWIDMARYPLSSVLLAGGLGALLAKNYSFLRSLLVFRYRVSNRERIACDQLAPVSALGGAATSLYQQKRHTPASEHFANVLAPLAAELHPSPATLFDELEVWVALAYLDVVRDLTATPVWMPPGKFCWQSRFNVGEQPDLLLADADAAGAAWEPLSAGWFEGSSRRWEQVKTAFSETYRRISSSMW